MYASQRRTRPLRSVSRPRLPLRLASTQVVEWKLIFLPLRGLSSSNLRVFVCLEANQAMFDIENKVRTIVADMLLNMNDKLTLTNRDVKNLQTEMNHTNTKINETNLKLDREAKIKDLVDNLKHKIQNLVSHVKKYNRLRLSVICE